MIFFLFCICASVVVFNILTAFAIKDVDEVLKKANISKLLKKAEYITYYEKSFFGRYMDLNIETQVEVKPGIDAEQRHHFSKKLVAKWIEEAKKSGSRKY